MHGKVLIIGIFFEILVSAQSFFIFLLALINNKGLWQVISLDDVGNNAV
jgi:hypothetical protein